MGLVVTAVGLVMIIFAGIDSHQLGLTSAIIATAGGAVLLLGIILTLLSLYRRTSADVAFVRTGLGGMHVALDSGAYVMPIVHRIIEINLKTMKLGVNPRGQNALITHDNLRANVLAQFYIRVQADREHILNAARSLGESSVNAEAVEALVSEKLVSALRAIASQMDLFEIHTKRDEFAEKVKEHVKSDLEANGLLLESVTISELDQTDPAELSDNNVFDAQGKRKITEITAAAQVERNNLEREAERARKLKDVETRQTILGLEQKQAESEALQATEVAKVRATQERESQEALITQQRQIELARIEKDKQLQAQAIASQQAIEIARAQQEQAVQTATVQRDQTVALAERQKQIAVANQEADRAKAEELALRAEAERQKAEQQVTSVVQLAEADREASKKLIAARQEIEQNKLRQQTSADVEAYTRVRQADADREAAEKQASAQLQLAEADSHAKELVARGQKAQQMVAVEVSREQVNVDQAKVAVERQQLENRQEFAKAGIELEVQKLSITADRDVQMEFARALAGFLSSGHMTLYGTPETASTMMNNMAKGFGLRSLIDGFVSGTGNSVGGNGTSSNGASKNGHSASSSDAVGALLGQIGSLIQPAIAKVTAGQTPEKSDPDAIAKALAENPAFLAALKEAISTTTPITSTQSGVETQAAIVTPLAEATVVEFAPAPIVETIPALTEERAKAK